MKKTGTLLVAALFMATSYGQIRLQTVAGTSGNDRNYHLTATPDGGLVGTGYTQSVPGNGNDAFLVRYDALGQVKWAKTYGDTANETTWDIVIAGNGDHIAAGNTRSISVNEAALLIRSDDQGNVIWANAWHYPGGQVSFYRVIESSSGDLIAGGLARINNSAAFIMARISASGNMIWHKTIQTSGNDEIMGLMETSQGDFVFSGLTGDPQGGGASDFAVVKAKPNGDIVWQRRYGGSASERINTGIEHNNAYYFMGFGNVNLIGGQDVIVLKTDTAGNPIWTRAYGTPEAERSFNMMYSPANDAIMVAGYTDYSDPTTNNRNTFLMQIDFNGQLDWAKSYGSTNVDGHWPTGFTTNADSGFYMLASTNSMGPGIYSLYLMKTDLNGEAGCNMKNPQFTSAPITDWVTGNFGTDTTLNLTASPTGFSGATWNLTDTILCCELFAPAGSDAFLCHQDTVILGGPALDGLSYVWTKDGQPYATTAQITLSYGDAATYALTVSAPGTNCQSDTKQAIITEDPTPRPIISSSGDTLYSNALSGNLWFLDGQPVMGATNQSFFPMQGGVVQVGIFTPAGCLALSDPLVYSRIGTESWSTFNLKIYPNPAKDAVRIDVPYGFNLSDITIVNSNGKIVHHLDVKNQNTQIDIDIKGLPSGLYVIQIQSEDGRINRSRITVL
jgi:hypothetical protein